jgi:putative endonuclease
MRTYYVYMLRCFDGTFYVGLTNNMERRFGEHCVGLDPGCYTFSRRPLQLVSVNEFGWIQDAIAFEKQLKRWGHRKKRAFAEKAWRDLKRFARDTRR